jgi:hypothetical protein
MGPVRHLHLVSPARKPQRWRLLVIGGLLALCGAVWSTTGGSEWWLSVGWVAIWCVVVAMSVWWRLAAAGWEPAAFLWPATARHERPPRPVRLTVQRERHAADRRPPGA